MKYLRILISWPVRAKMLFLFAVVILFAFGTCIWLGLRERRNEIEAANRNALLLVHSLAAQQEQIEGATKEILRTLARSSEVQGLDRTACNGLLRKFSIQHPYYSILGVITPDGSLFASSGPFDQSINVADQKHFRDAIGSQGFSAGEYAVGKITGVQTIHYAYPVLDSWKHLIAVVSAGFRLDRYAGFIARANLPTDSVVVITDHKGIRLYRSKQCEGARLGSPIPGEAIERMSGALDEGVYEGVAGDGTYRINAFKLLHLRQDLPPHLYMIVGMVKKSLLHRNDFIIKTNLLLAGFAVVAAVFLALVLSEFLNKTR